MQNSDTIESILLGFEIDILRFSDGLSQQAIESLWQLENDLVALLQNIAPTEILTDAIKQARLYELETRANALIDRVFDLLNQTISNNLSDIANITTDFLVNTLSTDEHEATKVTTDINNIYIIGATFGEWINRQKQQYKQNLIDNIRLGVVQNKATHELVKTIRGVSTGRRHSIKSTDPVFFNTTDLITEYKNGIFDGQHRKLNTLVQTSVQAVTNDVLLATYKQNQELVRGVHALVTLDNRTSILCKERSGFEWSVITGKPLNSITNIDFPGNPPWHWHCRTILVPILAGKHVTPILTYEDWLNTQTTKTQLDILGNARYKLWQDKKLNVNELTNKTGRTLTIQQLIQKYK